VADDSRQLTEEEVAALSDLESEDSGVSHDISSELGYLAPHNLANEDRTIGINVGAIDMITERFTRHFRLGLLEVLRSSPKIHVDAVKTVVFEKYLSDLAPPLSVNTIRINPLRGSSLVVLDPNVVFAALDNFFGGFGRGIAGLPPGRMFTPTETRIINIMMELIFASLKEAWAPIMPIECEYVSAEINPQFVQIADEKDLVVVCHLSVEISEAEVGRIDIVYPFASLKPIRDELRARVQSDTDTPRDAGLWHDELETSASYAELEAVVTLGETEIPLHQFQSLRSGDVLWFKKYEDAQMIIEGVPVFAADVGTVKGQVAIKIVNSNSFSAREERNPIGDE
jgi:flagellar motor switch protein FliM